MEKLKRFIKRIPGLYPVALLALEPKHEFKRWQNFYNFRRNFQGILNAAPSVKQTKKMLVVSLLGRFVPAIKEEALFVKAAQIKGVEPYILTSHSSWANRYYRIFGVKNFVYFEDYFGNIPEQAIVETADADLNHIQSFDDLMAYEYKGVKVGKYICSSLVRKTYTGIVDVRDSETRRKIQNYLVSTMMNTEAAIRIYDDIMPDSALFLERGYTPYGEFFDIALNRGLNAIQWCGCHRDNAFMLKRYSRDNESEHPASLSPQTWEILKKFPWDDPKGNMVKRELYGNYSSGEWFSEVGTQFNTKVIGKEQLQKALGLDPNKKTAVIFPHLFWDATFFWGADLFENYRQWFAESVKAMVKNTNLNWVIKVHPANIVKLNRDGYHGELVEIQTIRQEIGDLPSHIKVMPPNTPISTYSLFEGMDYCVTVRGTIGIEASIFGIPVLTAGTGRYDRHGFTIDSDTREEYLQKIAKLHTFPRCTKEQIELAQKFAYGTFLLRPFDVKSLHISYKKDATATQTVDYTLTSQEDLLNASDIQAVGDWLVSSKAADYLENTRLTSLSVLTA